MENLVKEEQDFPKPVEEDCPCPKSVCNAVCVVLLLFSLKVKGFLDTPLLQICANFALVAVLSHVVFDYSMILVNALWSKFSQKTNTKTSINLNKVFLRFVAAFSLLMLFLFITNFGIIRSQLAGEAMSTNHVPAVHSHRGTSRRSNLVDEAKELMPTKYLDLDPRNKIEHRIDKWKSQNSNLIDNWKAQYYNLIDKWRDYNPIDRWQDYNPIDKWQDYNPVDKLQARSYNLEKAQTKRNYRSYEIYRCSVKVTVYED